MTTRTFIPLFVSVIVFLLLMGGYVLCYNNLISMSAQAQKLDTTIAQKKAELAQIASASTALSALSMSQAVIEQYSVSKSDIVPFLGTLQATGKQLGATVEVLSVSDVTEGGHDRIELPLSITGSFDAVMRTVGAIEYGPYDGVIKNLTLGTTNTQGASAPAWSAAVLFSVGTRTGTSTATTTP